MSKWLNDLNVINLKLYMFHMLIPTFFFANVERESPPYYNVDDQYQPNTQNAYSKLDCDKIYFKFGQILQ